MDVYNTYDGSRDDYTGIVINCGYRDGAVPTDHDLGQQQYLLCGQYFILVADWTPEVFLSETYFPAHTDKITTTDNTITEKDADISATDKRDEDVPVLDVVEPPEGETQEDYFPPEN